jgi:tetratricopeptide (TPR) repeat protein
MQRAARLVIGGVLLFAAYWALRIGWASHLYHRGSADSIRQAAAMVPMNADYQARAGNLRRAVELNPYMASAWIELGLAAEAGGSYAEAERLLLEAAQVDRTFEPRWTLANYYFRRNHPGPFWEWIRRAAERSYGSRDAIFRLCWRMSRDGEEILEKAIPADSAILRDYVEFLVGEQKPVEAVPPATALLPHATAAHRATLLGLTERLIEKSRTAAAVGLWNGLIARGLIAFDPLDPPSGRLLTNPALVTEPDGRGFDWRLHWVAGVESSYAHTRQLRIGLSGKQEPFTQLLSQVIPASGPGLFRFRYRYRTEGIERPGGLHWRVWDLRRARWLEPGSEPMAAIDWREQEHRFSIPEGGGPVRLTLVYERPMGTPRAEGTLMLDGAFGLDPIK